MSRRKKHDDAELQSPDPDKMALKLFILATLGCIGYGTAVLILT